MGRLQTVALNLNEIDSHLCNLPRVVHPEWEIPEFLSLSTCIYGILYTAIQHSCRAYVYTYYVLHSASLSTNTTVPTLQLYTSETCPMSKHVSHEIHHLKLLKEGSAPALPPSSPLCSYSPNPLYTYLAM